MLLKRYSSLGKRELKSKLKDSKINLLFYTNLIRFRIGVNKLRVLMTLNPVYLIWINVSTLFFFKSLRLSHA